MLGKLQSTLGRGVIRLVSTNALGILDQAVVSAAGFATTVIIGRCCGASELGRFTLGWSLVPIILGVQWSLITMPYTFRCRNYSELELRLFNGAVLSHNGLMGVAALLVLVAAAAVAALSSSNGDLAFVLIGLAGATPFILVREFARRFEMARLDVITALVLDGVVAVVQVLTLIVLFLSGHLNGATAFLALAVACAVGSLASLVKSRTHYEFSRARVLSAWTQNFAFGKWMFAGRAAVNLRFALIPWIVGMTVGHEATGEYAAIYNVAHLIAPFIIALGNIAAPSASVSFSDGGAIGLKKFAFSTTVFATSVALVLSVLIAVFGERLVSTAYGSGFSAEFSVIVALLIAFVSQAIAVGPTNGMLAVGRPDLIFWTNALGFVVTFASCMVLMEGWGIVGAATALALGSVISNSAKVVWFWWLMRAEAVAKG
jgi:O-antigen/teichoic acid export membrane protein